MAAYWYEKAALLAVPEAMVRLGWLHERGAGVLREYARAFILYERAALQGDGMGMGFLAWLYAHGPRSDPAKAQVWFDKAERQGITKATIEEERTASLHPNPMRAGRSACGTS